MLETLGVVIIVLLSAATIISVLENHRYAVLEARIERILFDLHSLTEEYVGFRDDLLDGTEPGGSYAPEGEDEGPCDCPECRADRGLPPLLIN